MSGCGLAGLVVLRVLIDLPEVVDLPSRRDVPGREDAGHHGVILVVVAMHAVASHR